MDERESSSGQPDISVDESRLQSTAMAGSEDNLTRLADHSDSQGDLLPDSYSLQEKPGGLPEAALSTREQQLAFLVTIGDLLGSSLSYEKTLRHLAELLVPRFADWCAIDIANGQDTLERLTVAHANPEKLRLASELYERYPRPQGSQSAAAVFRSGQAQWAQSIPDEWLVEAATDERHLATLRELGLRSYVSVPLSARGVVLGVLTLVTAESGRAYEQEDLIFAQAIASRAAVTIDNTRLFEAAENSLDRLQFTLDAADLGTWEWNVDTGEVTWTEGLMRIHRRKPGEFDGTVDSALSDLHPQDREYVMGAITAALETDAPYHVEYRIITAEK
ncbi:MAG TPA: GAF domain-containing protein, partial [Nitrococcus sp.]|nr:GAF domain-containing protein [Nitrococcus sp.]